MFALVFPVRQRVVTIPKILRVCFKCDRKLLRLLSFLLSFPPGDHFCVRGSCFPCEIGDIAEMHAGQAPILTLPLKNNSLFIDPRYLEIVCLIHEAGAEGGRPIQNLAAIAGEGKISGIDFSEESVPRLRRSSLKLETS
jgi:hypothetical protein